MTLVINSLESHFPKVLPNKPDYVCVHSCQLSLLFLPCNDGCIPRECAIFLFTAISEYHLTICDRATAIFKDHPVGTGLHILFGNVASTRR